MNRQPYLFISKFSLLTDLCVLRNKCDEVYVCMCFDSNSKKSVSVDLWYCFLNVREKIMGTGIHISLSNIFVLRCFLLPSKIFIILTTLWYCFVFYYVLDFVFVKYCLYRILVSFHSENTSPFEIGARYHNMLKISS